MSLDPSVLLHLVHDLTARALQAEAERDDLRAVLERLRTNEPDPVASRRGGDR